MAGKRKKKSVELNEHEINVLALLARPSTRGRELEAVKELAEIIRELDVATPRGGE